MFHISCLHEFGSNNKKGIASIFDFLVFSPYYTVKDTLTIYFSFFVISIFVFFLPDILGHSLNYELANILVTPSHIVPE
jgi:ubiquinol-cytochrome c reductase cytochrome b/c1 subunit